MADQVLSYDGFISYSHAADGLLAPRLQSALQRFAKPWWKRRAVRIFRDETSLSANPHLWSSITEALDTSGWFVLLLSPNAARSEWVNQEINYWIENRDPKRILPVVTDGDFGWADGDVAGDAAPESLRGMFSEEPRWVDLRFARSEEQLDLKNPRFSAAVADIASAIRDIPKEDLESEEVRQHRRTVRTAWTVGVTTAVFAVATVGFGISASTERDRADAEAERATQLALQEESARESAELNAERATRNADEAQRNALLARARGIAAAAVSAISEDPELASLLSLAAIDTAPDGTEVPSEIVNALWETGTANRLTDVVNDGEGGLSWISLSADGTRLAVSSTRWGWVRMYDAPTMELIWQWDLRVPGAYGQSGDNVSIVTISPDGALVAVSVAQPNGGRVGVPLSDTVPDFRPNRIVLLNGASGTEFRVIEYPDCFSVDLLSWSVDGSRAAVTNGRDPCPRDGAEGGVWIEVFDTTNWQPIALVETSSPFFGLNAAFDDLGRLFVFREDTAEMFTPPDYRLARSYEAAGFGAVSPDGSRIVTTDLEGSNGRIGVFDTDTGSRTDLLTPFENFPRLPIGLAFSSEGRRIASANDSNDAMVWDVRTGELEARLPGGVAQSIAVDDQRDRAYTSHTDGAVRVWDLSPSSLGRSLIAELENGPALFTKGFAIGPELGAMVFNRFPDDPIVRFFDLETGDLLDYSQSMYASGLEPIALDDGRFLVETEPGVVLAVDPRAGATSEFLRCGDPAVTLCDASGERSTPTWHVGSLDGEMVLIAAAGNQAPQVFDAETGETIVSGVKLRVFDSVSAELVKSRDLLFAAFDEPITFTAEWILGAGTSSLTAVDFESNVLWQRTIANFHRSEISRTDRYAAIYDTDSLLLLELGTWRESVLSTELGFVRAFAFSPGDTRLAAADEAGVSIFDAESGELTQYVPIPMVTDMYWFDDETILYASRSREWATFSLDVDRLVEEVRSGMLRSLTAQECSRYRLEPCPPVRPVGDA